MKTEPWYMRKEIVEIYESFYEGKYRNADLMEKEAILRCIKFIGDVNSILEVGCGTAHFTRWLHGLGYATYGLDISNQMLKQARNLWPEGELIRGTSYFLPFRQETFDAVIFITCLEYMKDTEKAICEAGKVAKKGILVGLMNSWSLPTLRRRFQVLLGLNDFYRDAHFYSMPEIVRIMRRALKGKYELSSISTVFPFSIIRFSKMPLGAFLCVAARKS